MKKWLSIVLVSCYLLISMGVQLHLHYCCGELSDVHFFNHHACNHSGEDADHCCKKNNCCSYVHLDFSVEDSHQAASQTAPQHFKIELEEPLFAAQAPITGSVQSPSPEADASPPPLSRRFVLFHSLILYA